MTIQLILASTSVYRQQLLQKLNLPFSTAKPDAVETPLPGESPTQLALRLAAAKAESIAARYPDALIIGSDQVAHAGGKLYGKPGTEAAAMTQLQQLSGQTVCFDTALCLFNNRSGEKQLECVTTRVTFRTLSPEEIRRYVDKERPLDCAGSAKSEGLGITLLESIIGPDPNALVGLPLISLCRMLRREGMVLP